MVELLLRLVEGSWWLSFGIAHFEAVDGIWNRVGVLASEVRRARSSCGDGECIVDEFVDQKVVLDLIDGRSCGVVARVGVVVS
jgi:hypothetical protein